MACLSESEIRQRTEALPDWRRDGSAITRELTFRNFPEAVAFVVRLAFDAEAADHHPDVRISYKRVTLSFTTHSEGGLTARDFEGAATVNALLAGR